MPATNRSLPTSYWVYDLDCVLPCLLSCTLGHCVVLLGCKWFVRVLSKEADRNNARCRHIFNASKRSFIPASFSRSDLVHD
ncbi:unnamed protein product [Linum tenue]|uniref:Uncharacterized protein n=1 Tax=Linum tenue TaxID=586396 RepID=A0AAV0K862_9ROSI|nr:unnamed protein product [Linum tenue]